MVAADGSGARQIPWSAGSVFTIFWSADQKFLYLTGFEKGASVPMVWKMNADGSSPEKIASDCGNISDGSMDGKYLIGAVWTGEKTGIYEFSIADKKCTLLVPKVETFGTVFARDDKSFLYATASQHDVTIYRQPWKDGKLTGPQQVGLKLPFAFPVSFGGNAYDFSRDLATVVYVRPSSHSDLYLLSKK